MRKDRKVKLMLWFPCLSLLCTCVYQPILLLHTRQGKLVGAWPAGLRAHDTYKPTCTERG